MLSASSIIVIGSQWGNEGKGKVVDFLAGNASAVVRFQGGHHTGRTVVVGKEPIVLHLIPAGILRPQVTGYISNAVVVSPIALCEEILRLARTGIAVENNLRISLSCPLMLHSHVALDKAKERSEGKLARDIMGWGMGPVLEDKVARRGLRIIDLLDESRFKIKLLELLDYHNFLLKHYYHSHSIDANQLYEELMGTRDILAPLSVNVSNVLYGLRTSSENIIYEGTQGSLLDIDNGIYPDTLSFNTVASAALMSNGLGFGCFDEVLGVTKAYCTRLGEGPFPSEQQNRIGELLAKRGLELTGTTGRYHRCGWLDLMALKFSIRINGITNLCITKLDVLDTLDKICLCIGYRIQGKEIQTFPNDMRLLSQCEPIYEVCEGWQQNTMGIQRWGNLPQNAKKYLKKLEQYLGVPISMISTGPKREEMIVLKPILKEPYLNKSITKIGAEERT